MDRESAHFSLAGDEFVVISRTEFERLTALATVVERVPLPAPDARGLVDAVGYARASIARGILRDRVNAGLTQRELAKRAGIRVETLCRIEAGRNTASIPTVQRIDKALRSVKKLKPRSGRKAR